MKHSDTIGAVCRFRRFTRRGYAAFASLHRCVTIGVLSADMAQCQMRKSASAVLRAIEGVGAAYIAGDMDRESEDERELQGMEMLWLPTLSAGEVYGVGCGDVTYSFFKIDSGHARL